MERFAQLAASGTSECDKIEMVKVKGISIKCISQEVTQSKAKEFAVAPLKFFSLKISVAKMDIINKIHKNTHN